MRRRLAEKTCYNGIFNSIPVYGEGYIIVIIIINTYRSGWANLVPSIQRIQSFNSSCRRRRRRRRLFVIMDDCRSAGVFVLIHCCTRINSGHRLQEGRTQVAMLTCTCVCVNLKRLALPFAGSSCAVILAATYEKCCLSAAVKRIRMRLSSFNQFSSSDEQVLLLLFLLYPLKQNPV